MTEENPAAFAAGQIKILRGLLVLTAVLLALGLWLPMLTISKFLLLNNSLSVLSGVFELFRGGHFVLFVLVSGFSIVLPVLKILLLFFILSAKQQGGGSMRTCLRLMHDYGRWAMLDVLVVAVLIVTVKLGVVASIEVHPGLYVFGAAVLLTMLITGRVVRLLDDMPAGRTPSGHS